MTGSFAFAVSARNAVQHDRALEIRFPRCTHIETPRDENSIGTSERQRRDLTAMAGERSLELGRRSENRVIGGSDETPFIDAGNRVDGSMEVLTAGTGERGEVVAKELVVGGAGDEMAVRIHGEASDRSAVAFQDPERRRTPRIGIDSVRREQENRRRGERDGEKRVRRVETDVGNAD